MPWNYKHRPSWWYTQTVKLENTWLLQSWLSVSKDCVFKGPYELQSYAQLTASVCILASAVAIDLISNLEFFLLAHAMIWAKKRKNDQKHQKNTVEVFSSSNYP